MSGVVLRFQLLFVLPRVQQHGLSTLGDMRIWVAESRVAGLIHILIEAGEDTEIKCG